MDVRLPAPPDKYDPADEAALRRLLEAALQQIQAAKFPGLVPRVINQTVATSDTENLVLVGTVTVGPKGAIVITPGSTCVVLPE